MATRALEIFLGNDFLEEAGPIWAREAATGERTLYHSSAVEAFVTAAKGSNTPITGLSVACPEIGDTACYPVAFEADDIDAALGSLPDRTKVYRVIRGPGDFRVEDEFLVRKSRPSVW